MHRKTILVLDADVQRRAQIRCILSLEGYKVLEAGTHSEAETICSAAEIAIDLVMQDADIRSGSQLLQCRPGTPLLLTAYSGPRVRICGDNFWRLPFDPEQLLSNVNIALEANAGVGGVVVL